MSMGVSDHIRRWLRVIISFGISIPELAVSLMAGFRLWCDRMGEVWVILVILFVLTVVVVKE